jgi:hypothetical protein
VAGYFFGSSPNSGEGSPDLEEEVGVVSEAVGHAFDDLDLVVDAFDAVRAQGKLAVRQDPGQIGLELGGEVFERFDPASSCS